MTEQAFHDVLSVDDVRVIQITLLHDKTIDYVKISKWGEYDPRAVLQQIVNVKNRKIRRIIEAVGTFDSEQLSDAWERFMAFSSGRHLWPDANHRTGFIGFLLASSRAFGLGAILSDDDARTLVAESKSLRDHDYLTRYRYYTLEELADPDHPYRRLYARFATKLQIVANPAESEMNVFVEGNRWEQASQQDP